MNPLVDRLLKQKTVTEPDPLEKRGVIGSMALNGPTGLQLPLEIHGSPIMPCRPSTRLGRWYGEPLKADASSSALNPTSLDSFICMASWQSVIGLFQDKQQPTSGQIFSKRSDARKCSRCGGIVVPASTSPSTSPKSSASLLSSEVKP